MRWTAALNYNHTQILSVDETPSQLTALGSNYQLLGRQSRALITKTSPSSKAIFSADWAIHDFDVNLRLTRYGTYTEVNSSADPSLDREYSAKWITDLDVAYCAHQTTDRRRRCAEPVRQIPRSYRRAQLFVRR